MKIHRNPFLSPNLNPWWPTTYIGKGVERWGFKQETFYKEAKTFRIGPIQLVFKAKIIEETVPQEINYTGHYGKRSN